MESLESVRLFVHFYYVFANEHVMASTLIYRVGFGIGMLALAASSLASACKGKDCADERVGQSRCVGNRIEFCGANNELSYDSCTVHPGNDKYCSPLLNACVTKEIYDAQTVSSSGEGGSMMHGSGGMHAGSGGDMVATTTASSTASSTAVSSSATGGGDLTLPLNGCDPNAMPGGAAALVDYSQNPTPAITFPGAGLEYTPACIKIKVGQSVLFLGNNTTFAAHPLVGGLADGSTKIEDPTSPILKTAAGQNATFAFNTPGAYGFYCDFHYVAGMKGAVYVIP